MANKRTHSELHRNVGLYNNALCNFRGLLLTISSECGFPFPTYFANRNSSIVSLGFPRNSIAPRFTFYTSILMTRGTESVIIF